MKMLVRKEKKYYEVVVFLNTVASAYLNYYEDTNFLRTERINSFSSGGGHALEKILKKQKIRKKIKELIKELIKEKRFEEIVSI